MSNLSTEEIVPTPRTDAVGPVEFFITDSDHRAVSWTDYECLLDLTRQLEREITALKRDQSPSGKKLGFAAAVREYGDNWRQHGFAWNGTSYRGLSPDTLIALGEHGPDADDFYKMKDCEKHGRMFQVGGL